MATRRLGTTLGALVVLASAALVPVVAASAQAAPAPTGLAPLLRDEDQPVVAGFARTIDLTRLASPGRVAVTSYAVDEPAHGHFEGDCSTGSCTYVPDEGHLGPDDLTVTAANAVGTSPPATLRLMTRPNQAPAAYDDLRVIDAGAPHTWRIGASDENAIVDDGIVVLDEPAHGDLACVADSCTYLPDPGFVGEDATTWQADDGLLVSRVATTHLVVRPNLGPVLLDHTLLVPSGQSAAVAGEATDSDGAPRAYAVAQAPQHGEVGACDSSGCTYTADPGYVGTDVFTWRASDGRAWSAPAKVLVSVRRGTAARSAGRAYLDVAPTSSAPVAVSGTYGAVAGRPTRLTLNLQPTDDAAIVEIVTPPAHGTITGCSGTVCEYVPDAGHAGDDPFTWRASTDAGTSGIAEARISVYNPPAPRADGPTTYTKNAGTTSRIYFDTWTSYLERVVIETQPAHGHIDYCSSLVCLYTADPGYTGADSFSWRADDGESVSDPLTTTVQVVDPGTAVGPGSVIEAVAGRPTTIPSRLRIASLPTRGELRCDGGTCRYRAAPSVTGTDTFQLVSRIAPTGPRATVIVEVRPDRTPVARTSAFMYLERTTTFSLPVTDPDEVPDHAFEVQVVHQPRHGQITSCSSASCTYEPDQGFRGIDDFSWRATDGRHLTPIVTRRVVVGPVALPEPRVTITNPSRRPRVGAVARWTTTVRGSAVEDLRETAVAWWVPDVLRVVARSLPRGCSVHGRHVLCVLGVLPAGATRTLRLHATPVQTGTAKLSVRLRAGRALLARAERQVRPTKRRPRA